MKQIFTRFFEVNSFALGLILMLSIPWPGYAFSNEDSIPLISVKPLLARVISGKVTDKDHQPLPGVGILIKGTKISTSTDDKGEFRISIPDDASILIFKSIGFASKEVSIGTQTRFNITLLEESSKLDEVVVVGYGSQSRELMTTAVSKLDKKILENIPYANVGAALQGSIPGLRVQSTSGQPGAAPRIVLRGGTSINNPNGAAPLYIIDGVIKDNGLNDLNSEDIESMQVLKDAASTAIYGARGSNGVIIVTTKSGKDGRTSISYSYDLTGSEPSRITEYASAADYIYYNRLGIVAASKKNSALLARNQQATGFGTGNNLTNSTAYTTMYLTADNEHKLNEGWSSMTDPIDPTKTIIFKERNYSDLLFQKSLSHNHNLNASGGSEKATFNVGLGYLSGDGTVVSTDYRRMSLNLNGSLQLKDNLGINGRILYSNRKSNALSATSTFYRSAALPGTAKYNFEDGTIAPGQNRSLGNPDYFLKGKYALQGDNSTEGLTMALGSRWEILKGLTFEPQVSLYRNTIDMYSFQPAALISGVGAMVTTREANASYNKTVQYQADAVLTYVASFVDAHHLEVKGGFSHFATNNQTLSGTGQGAATDLIPTLIASARPTLVGGQVSDRVLQGVFSRINYDYKEKYLLSLNLRYDGASNLGATKKFGFFPGISAGWNVHKEDFWKNLLPENLVDLKLRASYGVNGNISGLGDFQALGNYAVNNQYAGNAAVLSSVMPNPDLQWEQSKTFDVGLDMGLFNKRVSVIFDYYHRKTDNLLTTVSLPVSSGYSTVFTNLGSLENNGYEIAVDARMLSNESPFQWSFGVNAAKVDNKILKLPNNGILNNRIGGVNVYDPATSEYVWKGGLQEGGRIGDMYGYSMIGVYATNADAANAPVDRVYTGAKSGGDAIFADIDGNGIIDTRDQVYLGNPYPKWTGGISNYFTYKSLSLMVRMDFTTGATVYNYANLFANGQLQGDSMPTADYFANMWKKEGDVASMPRYVWQDQFGNHRGSNLYYENADFLALREVTLSYNLPKTFLNKVKLSNVRLNITGSNLHYFTKFSGQVPDDGGTDDGHYPIPRNLTFGLNVTF